MKIFYNSFFLKQFFLNEIEKDLRRSRFENEKSWEREVIKGRMIEEEEVKRKSIEITTLDPLIEQLNSWFEAIQTLELKREEKIIIPSFPFIHFYFFLRLLTSFSHFVSWEKW